jgi:hypothetical protein
MKPANPKKEELDAVGEEWFTPEYVVTLPETLDEEYLNTAILDQEQLLAQVGACLAREGDYYHFFFFFLFFSLQVDTALTTRVRNSYAAFVAAMKQISSLESSATNASVTATAGRAHLTSLSQGMVGPGLRLLRYKRRQQRQEAVIELLQQLVAAQNQLTYSEAQLARQQ